MWDEFETQEELTNKDKFLFVAAYIPFLNIGLYFLEINRTAKLQKFLNQWVTLFWVYIIAFILLTMFWGALWSLLTLWYLCMIAYLAMNAYKWEYVEISYLTNIIDRVFDSKK
jgi:hypothetical protein